MNVGLIGFGKMGGSIAQRLITGGHTVFGYDPAEIAFSRMVNAGIKACETIQEVSKNARVIWIMVPAGQAVDNVLELLSPHLLKGDVVIDGGNSHFPDSVRRATELEQRDIFFVDCGTSGGLPGRELGFSLMVGGQLKAYQIIEPLLQAVAAPNGFAYVGPSGAGHYIKMVHNGIEYGLLQAYGEGLHLLHDGRYKDLNLPDIIRVWQHGAVIRSFIGELAYGVLQHDQDLDDISGEVGGGQTGSWSVQEAHEQQVPLRVIEQALKIRQESLQDGGTYATKIVALLRNAFGGHPVKKIKK